MAETAQRSGGGATGQPEQSATDQAKEKVQETAQQVQEKAQAVKGQAGDRVRRELDTRSTQAGSQLKDSADVMRRTGDQLREEGKETPAKIATTVAERAERLGDYMSQVNADRLLRDVEDFARRQPLLFTLGGATLGFLAARFMKASSSNRYQSGNGSSHPSDQLVGAYGGPAGNPRELPAPINVGGHYGESVPARQPLGQDIDDPASVVGSGSRRGVSRGKSGQ